MKFSIEIEVTPEEFAELMQKLADHSGKSVTDGGANSTAAVQEQVSVVKGE